MPYSTKTLLQVNWKKRKTSYPLISANAEMSWNVIGCILSVAIPYHCYRIWKNSDLTAKAGGKMFGEICCTTESYTESNI